MVNSTLQNQVSIFRQRLSQFEGVLHDLRRFLDDLEEAASVSPDDYKPRPLHADAEIARMDWDSFSVSYRGNHCLLGDSISFRLLEQLLRDPNRYQRFPELLRTAWRGQRRSDDTVRTAIFRLRKQLRARGFPELAARIRAQGQAYGWITIPE